MPHHPPHIYISDTWYFLTARIYQNQPLLKSSDAKEFSRDLLKSLVNEFQTRIAAWVILDNHYHILLKSLDGSALPQFIRRFHGRISYELNHRDQTEGRQVWHNYWDTCIRTEKDYWTRFNYILQNPIKHRYAARKEDWPYSSYHFYLEHKGLEWLADAFRRYPIVDFSNLRDNF